jgi:hypothetical protein
VLKHDEVERARTAASIAVRDAFEAARRRLQDSVRRQRETVGASRTDLDAVGSEV